MSEINPSQPTRHQLDELEALMQRMLDLPVHQTDDPVVLPSELAETMKVEPVRLVISPPKAASVRESFVAAGNGEPVAESKQPDRPLLNRETTARPSIKRTVVVEEKAQPPVVAPRPRQRRPGFWYLQPLIWSNRVFDRSVGRFGRTGRWLRSSRGRAMLGWVGLVFIAAALTIGLLDAMGWTW